MPYLGQDLGQNLAGITWHIGQVLGKLGKILGKLVKILGRNRVQEHFAGLTKACNSFSLIPSQGFKVKLLDRAICVVSM